jgi:sigma-B regulation protein RsbU (phosphoserine phosphatase)
MATARSTLRAEARGGDSPRLVLRRVNDRIIQDTKENVFLTMTYGILDFRRKTFRFSRAGHEPLLTIGPRQMEPRLHTPNGIAVGMVETSLFDMIEELEVQFADGETAVLYTDGATEAMDANDEEYGHQRLYRSICARTEESCEEMLDGVAQDIGDFSQGCPQHDDITLVAIQCVGPPNRESLEETLGNAAAEKT